MRPPMDSALNCNLILGAGGEKTTPRSLAAVPMSEMRVLSLNGYVDGEFQSSSISNTPESEQLHVRYNDVLSNVL